MPDNTFLPHFRRQRRSVAFPAVPAVSDPCPANSADEGMATAEYAIGTVAAAAFAALLYTVVTGDSVLEALTSLVRQAISVDL